MPWLDRMGLGGIDFELLVQRCAARGAATARPGASARTEIPELLILDEITAALTPDQADHVFAGDE